MGKNPLFSNALTRTDQFWYQEEWEDVKVLVLRPVVSPASHPLSNRLCRSYHQDNHPSLQGADKARHLLSIQVLVIRCVPDLGQHKTDFLNLKSHWLAGYPCSTRLYHSRLYLTLRLL